MNKGLTSFRALAFFAVFFFHVHYFEAGYLGVQAFFVLSGFLLTPILMQMRQELDARHFFMSFYGRRALRIFPLYYMYLLGMTVICLLFVKLLSSQTETWHLFLEQLPWAATYTYNFFHISSSYEYTPLITHFWSLAVEEQFYLLWPLLIFWINPRYIKVFLVFIVLLSPAIRFLILNIATENTLGLLNERVDFVVHFITFSHFDAFAIGGFFALYKRSTSNIFILCLIVSVLGLGYATEFAATGKIKLLSLGYSHFMVDKYIWGYTLINLVFAYVLVQLKDGKFLSIIFENKYLHYLGEISYGLYIFHFPMIWMVGQVTLWPLNIILSLLLTILISSLSYEYFEKRLINMKDDLFPKHSKNIQPHPERFT